MAVVGRCVVIVVGKEEESRGRRFEMKMKRKCTDQLHVPCQYDHHVPPQSDSNLPIHPAGITSDRDLNPNSPFKNNPLPLRFPIDHIKDPDRPIA